MIQILYLLRKMLIQNLNLSFAGILVLYYYRAIKHNLRLADTSDISTSSILFKISLLEVFRIWVDQTKAFVLFFLN
jgi:hypothetical protein